MHLRTFIRRGRRLVPVVGVAAVVAALALVFSGGASAANQAVSVSNFAFNPASITVAQGDSVTWTNNDATAHTVSSDTSGVFDSGNLAPSRTFSFTFNTAGTFAYHCNIHPFMHGTVVVTAAAAGASPTAAGASPTAAASPTGAASPTATATRTAGASPTAAASGTPAAPSTGSGMAQSHHNSALTLGVLFGGLAGTVALGAGIIAIRRK